MEHFVRSGALEGFGELVRELGGNAKGILRAAGIDPAALDESDTRIAYRHFLTALAKAAERTKRPDFGLLLADRQSFSMLGAVGFAMREAPTFRAAIDDLCNFLPTHMSGARSALEQDGETAIWSYRIVMTDPPGFEQQIDLAVGIGFRIMQKLAGGGWTPEMVYLERKQPAATRPYEAFFGCPVLYGQELSALVFDTALLDRPTPRANIELYRILHEYLVQRADDAPNDFVSKVRENIWRQMQIGDCTIDRVAAGLAITRRTFQRRLSAHGLIFKDLLEETRMEMAKRFLKNSEAPLTEVADMLGYSELSAFSRSFKRYAGVPPRAWRLDAAQMNAV